MLSSFRSFSHQKREFLGLVLATSWLVSSSSVEAATLVNDNFSDGNITSSAPAGTVDPTSLAWWGNDATNVAYQDGQLRIYNSVTGARNAVAHFTPQGQAITLEQGHSLSLSFNFQASGAVGPGAGNLMRFGLFNSNNDPGSYITSNKANSGMKFDGYAVSMHNSSSANFNNTAAARADIMVRDHLKGQSSPTAVNGGALITNSSGYYNAYSEAVANYPLADLPKHDVNAVGNPYSVDTHSFETVALNTLYTGQLTLTRVDENTMRVTSRISGGGLDIRDEYLHVGENHNFTDPASNKVGRSTFTFDTLAFSYFWNEGNGMREMLIDNVLLTHTVPEPQRAMLALLGVGGLLMRRRR